MTLRVALAYNLKRPLTANERVPEDFFAEFDDKDTVDAIAGALRRGGCRVNRIEADENAYGKLRKIRPDIVFNIAEGLRGESRESHIPATLEMLDIPYTGSGPLTLAIGLNKAVTHQILEANRIPHPNFQIFKRADERIDPRLKLPAIVKPLSEGSSKGIRNNSLARDEESLRRQLLWVIETYNQPAIAEEFMSGREFTVGLIGNEEPRVLPMVEILLSKLPREANPIYSYEAKDRQSGCRLP